MLSKEKKKSKIDSFMLKWKYFMTNGTLYFNILVFDGCETVYRFETFNHDSITFYNGLYMIVPYVCI